MVLIGTNFYWREDCLGPCRHCDLGPIHVGKRSAGWSFGFRAYHHRLMDEAHPEWGFEVESPFGHPVRSRADWRRVFTERAGRLVDEYGREEPDPLAWLDGLAVPDVTRQRLEDSPERMGRWYRRDPNNEWRDPEGFRFYAGDFS